MKAVFVHEITQLSYMFELSQITKKSLFAEFFGHVSRVFN